MYGIWPQTTKYIYPANIDSVEKNKTKQKTNKHTTKQSKKPANIHKITTQYLKKSRIAIYKILTSYEQLVWLS